MEPTDPVPTGPIVCGCCGHPLELSCPGQCGAEHADAALAAAAAALNPAAHVGAPRRRRTAVRAPLPAKSCKQCESPFIPITKRAAFCPTCRAAVKPEAARLPRTYRVKPCAQCAQPFAPTGPNHQVCARCKNGGGA